VPLLENEPKSFAANEMVNKKKSNTVNIQCMISMTKLEWKELIETFEIEIALIPDPKKKDGKKK
jgi:hypothetical protein